MRDNLGYANLYLSHANKMLFNGPTQIYSARMVKNLDILVPMNAVTLLVALKKLKAKFLRDKKAH